MIVYMMCAEREWKIKACLPSTAMVSMLGSFSACDKNIQRSVNTIARDEYSMAMESRRNVLLSLLCVKKNATERQRRFTVMRRRTRRRCLEEFQKQQAKEETLFSC